MAKIGDLGQYIKDSKNEMKNVTWPSRAEVKKHTLLVIGISLAVALFLGIIDYFLTIGFERFF